MKPKKVPAGKGREREGGPERRCDLFKVISGARGKSWNQHLSPLFSVPG